MENNNKKGTIQSEIIKTSLYRSLIITKYYLTTFLAISFLLLAVAGYTESAFYILLSLNAIPPILSIILKDYSKKQPDSWLFSFMEDNAFILDNLKAKYSYLKIKHITNFVSYLITLVLLILWQFTYLSKGGILQQFIYLPTILVVSSLFVHLMLFVFYIFKIKYDLSNNRL